MCRLVAPGALLACLGLSACGGSGGPVASRAASTAAPAATVLGRGVTVAGIPYSVQRQGGPPTPAPNPKGPQPPGVPAPSRPPAASGPAQPPGVPAPHGSATGVRCPGIVFEAGAVGSFGAPCLTPATRTLTTAVNCTRGYLTVIAATVRGVRTATLKLSDGRSFTSPVYSVAHGNGAYFQIVRGPLPIPVSLTVHGRVSGLARVVGCTPHPVH